MSQEMTWTFPKRNINGTHGLGSPSSKNCQPKRTALLDKTVYIEGVNFMDLRRQVLALKERLEELDKLAAYAKGMVVVMRVHHPETECKKMEDLLACLRGLSTAISR